jgi:hypothetical protein
MRSPSRRARRGARDRGCTFPGCHRRRYLDGHHLKHWIHGGETTPDNMTLLCTYHHRLLHGGGFATVRDEGGTLRFVTADGRSIPRNGYRLEDFVDDDVGAEDADQNPPREHYCPEISENRFNWLCVSAVSGLGSISASS